MPPEDLREISSSGGRNGPAFDPTPFSGRKPPNYMEFPISSQIAAKMARRLPAHRCLRLQSAVTPTLSGANQVQTCPTPLHDTTGARIKESLAVSSQILVPTTLRDTSGAGL
jgi:hypothetical protein